MDKDYLIHQLMDLAKQNNIELSEEILGKIVYMSIVHVVSKGEILRQVENDELKNVYIMLLENALRYKIYRENGFLVENATERYLHFKKLYPTICEKVKQHHLASYLGIAPESLSRIRKALKESYRIL